MEAIDLRDEILAQEIIDLQNTGQFTWNENKSNSDEREFELEAGMLTATFTQTKTHEEKDEYGFTVFTEWDKWECSYAEVYDHQLDKTYEVTLTESDLHKIIDVITKS